MEINCDCFIPNCSNLHYYEYHLMIENINIKTNFELILKKYEKERGELCKFYITYFMKLSELYSKEIINIDTGENLGIFGDCDLVIEEKTGEIVSFISGTNSHFSLFKEPKRKEVFWKNIKKIGSDMIIIEDD